VIDVALPMQQCRVSSQQLLQAVDVIVVNEAARLRNRPVEAFAQAFAHLRGEILPAGAAVLAREYQLRIALRQRQIDVRHLRARTGDGIGMVGGGVARQFLCLFTEGFERRTSRKRFRSGHCDLLS